MHIISEQNVILRISTWYMPAGRLTVDEKDDGDEDDNGADGWLIGCDFSKVCSRGPCCSHHENDPAASASEAEGNESEISPQRC